MIAESGLPTARVSPAWQWAMGTIAIGLCLLVALFWHAASKAVGIWSTSSAYNHAFLIAPISLYLVYERRASLVAITPAPDLRALVLALPFAAAWLLAAAAEIDEGRQIALVGFMQVLFLAVLGWPAYRALAFPLLYLWLMVPTGEFLLAPLQAMTAATATEGLRVAGVPVFAEGMQIETPTGTYNVAPGCAGLNFLLAALAFSLLFTNLVYRGRVKRAAAVAVGLAAAIVANWVRVWAIILIDHFTDRQTDIVADHLLYGWGFFAVVMLVAMWLGLRLRDDTPAAAAPTAAAVASPRPIRFTAAAGLTVVLAALAPAYLAYAATSGAVSAGAFRPPPAQGWQAGSGRSIPDWAPAFADADFESRTGYRGPDGAVELVVAYFAGAGGEMAGGANRLADSTTWREVGGGMATATLDGRAQRIAAFDFRRRGEGRRLRLWRAYWADGRFVTGRLATKLARAKQRLGFGKPGAAVVLLATEVESGTDAADATLGRFAASLGPLGPTLAAVAGAGE